MIDPADHYKRICSQIDFYSQRTVDAFNRFIQLSIVTIGGFIWLKTQPNAKEAVDLFPLVRWIIPTLAVFTVVQLIFFYQSWWGFRQAEATLLGRADVNTPPPEGGGFKLRLEAGLIDPSGRFAQTTLKLSSGSSGF